MNIGKLARLLCVLLLAAPLQATAVTYVMDTIVANWIDSSTHNKITTVSAPYKFTGTGCGTAPPTLDDVISDSIPIGFNFMYGGVVFSNLRVMSNGRLQFGNTTCGSGTQSIGPPQTFPYGYPDANMNYTMRIYGGDLDATLKKSAATDPLDSVNAYPTTCTSRASCYISYAVIGTAPNRSFVVTWNNVPEWVNNTQTAGNFNLQIILQENGEFIYQFGVTNYASTGRAQVGWQVDTQDYEASAVGLPASGTAFKYYIPRPAAEYRMEQSLWSGAAGEVLDTSGNARHASRVVVGAGVVAPQTVPNAAGYICRGANISANPGPAPSANFIGAIATPLNMATDVGSAGTITFWYKPVSAATWTGATAVPAMLFDATTASGEYFYLAKTMSGATAQLRFVVRDSLGNTRVATAAAPTLNASGSAHIGVTWSFNPLAAANSDFVRIYVNGVKVGEFTFTTAAGISPALGSLHIGDNRSSFVENALYGNAANGVIDEFRVYNYAGALGLILRDMNQANVCLDHYAIQHAGTGFTCTPNQVTVQTHTGGHGLVIMPNNTTMVRLKTSTGVGDWSLISGYGVLNNGTANDGDATYIFNGEYQAVFGLTHPVSGTVNISVTDGQIIELSGEDPDLVLSSCGTTAAFNACEKTAVQCVPQKPPVNKYDHLFTKLATTAFDLDFVALKNDGTLDTGFNGQASVSLLANLSNVAINSSTNCPTAASAATVPLGTLTFSAGRATKNIGAAAFSSVAPNYSAYKDVRANFACDVANCGQVINVCSSDNFSVRPQGFTVGVTKTDASALNNASFSAGTPSLRAGDDFLITATGVAGYNGAPTIVRTVAAQTVASHLSATDYVGNLRDASGSSTISLGSATVTSGLSTGTVQYHDYGQFRLKAGAVRDSVFAAADGGNGDCVLGSTSNTASGGQFGCDVANQADTGLFGRFYPSYFAVAGTLTPACAAGNFSYFGQPFTLNYTVSAMSFPNPQLADTTIMTRYGAGTVSVVAYDGSALVDLSGNIRDAATGVNRADVGAWNNGVFSPTATSDAYTRGAPAAPVVAGYVAIGATGPDGVIVQRATGSKTIADDRNFKAGTPACAAACTHKKVGGVPTRFRYGRLSLGNAYGSELLDLPIPLEAQYWAAAGYYVTNRDDVCTAINPSSIKLAGFSQNLAACETQFSPTGLQTLVGGKLPLRMTRPGAGNNGGVGLELNIGSVASGTTCVAAASSPATAASLPWFGIVNPAARASFGAFRTPLIYRREVY